MSSAARRWGEALASWAIPQHILEAAPESPWEFPVELFASRADAALSHPTPSNHRAQEAFPDGGVVLDVGCGAGAAALPLASRASLLVGVDPSAGMLEAFLDRTRELRVDARAIEGSWPEMADEAPMADVVVCHNVFYNVPDLPAFALALTDHARRRVVVELTRKHPLSTLNDLWMLFHGIHRPEEPTADTAVDVLSEAGLEPRREDWAALGFGGFARREDLIGFVRRRLCLTADRDLEIEEAVSDRIVERDGRFGFPPRPMVTLWWPGGLRSP
jgi:SAM-dependent methyltransferase